MHCVKVGELEFYFKDVILSKKFTLESINLANQICDELSIKYGFFWDVGLCAYLIKYKELQPDEFIVRYNGVLLDEPMIFIDVKTGYQNTLKCPKVYLD